MPQKGLSFWHFYFYPFSCVEIGIFEAIFAHLQKWPIFGLLGPSRKKIVFRSNYSTKIQRVDQKKNRPPLEFSSTVPKNRPGSICVLLEVFRVWGEGACGGIWYSWQVSHDPCGLACRHKFPRIPFLKINHYHISLSHFIEWWSFHSSSLIITTYFSILTQILFRIELPF